MEHRIKKYSNFDKGDSLLERGGFRQFLNGIGQGVKGLADKTVFGDLINRGVDELTAKSLIESAENLKTSVQYAATEIDNVIAFRKSTGVSDFGDVNKIQDKLREIYKYIVQELPKDIDPKSGKSYSSIKKKLDGYSKEMNLVLGSGKSPGLLDNWKETQLGKNSENVISSEFLSTGKDLVAEAKSILQNISNKKYMQKKADSNNGTVLMKKALDAIRGTKDDNEELPNRLNKKGEIPKSRKEYKTFPKEPKNSDKEIVSSHQNRLKDLGYLKDYEKGVYDQKTKDGESKALSYLSKITGKKYGESDEDFKEFQRDLAYYSDNKGSIRKKLGLS